MLRNPSHYYFEKSQIKLTSFSILHLTRASVEKSECDLT